MGQSPQPAQAGQNDPFIEATATMLAVESGLGASEWPSFMDMARTELEQPAQPDAYCHTTPDGECISTDPRCMHQAAQPNQIALSPEKGAEFQRVIEGPAQEEKAAKIMSALIGKLYQLTNLYNDRTCDYDVCKEVRDARAYIANQPDTFTPDEYEFEVRDDGELIVHGFGTREHVIKEASLYAASRNRIGVVEIKYFARADVTARLVGEQGEG